MPATDRAAHVTNDTDTADAQRPARLQARRPRRRHRWLESRAAADEANGAGPDAVITMKIQAKYAGDEVVKGRNIDVDTDKGVVTLKGRGRHAARAGCGRATRARDRGREACRERTEGRDPLMA